MLELNTKIIIKIINNHDDHNYHDNHNNHNNHKNNNNRDDRNNHRNQNNQKVLDFDKCLILIRAQMDYREENTF